jgi:hypothetical protein
VGRVTLNRAMPSLYRLDEAACRRIGQSIIYG